jgi:hypothetical protein
MVWYSIADVTCRVFVPVMVFLLLGPKKRFRCVNDSSHRCCCQFIRRLSFLLLSFDHVVGNDAGAVRRGRAHPPSVYVERDYKGRQKDRLFVLFKEQVPKQIGTHGRSDKKSSDNRVCDRPIVFRIGHSLDLEDAHQKENDDGQNETYTHQRYRFAEHVFLAIVRLPDLLQVQFEHFRRARRCWFSL